MNHITQEQARELAYANDLIVFADSPASTERLCNAAIEWHIAQHAAPKEPLTDEQKLEMLKADSYFHQRESYLQGVEDAEKHHGIGGKV